MALRVRSRPDDGQRLGLRQVAGHRPKADAELGGVVSLGDLGGGRPHQDVVEGAEGLVLGEQGTDPGHEGGHGGVADERRLAGDRLVEHDGEGVDVGLAVEHPALPPPLPCSGAA